MKKRVKYTLLAILALVVLIGITGFCFYKRFVVYAPDPQFETPADLREAQAQDLTYLSLLPEYDLSFDSGQKLTDFHAGIVRLQSRLPVEPSVFEMEVAKIIASARNTHTNVSPSARARRMNAVPLRFYWFAEGLHVVLARDQYAGLLGARVLAIDGQSPAAMLSDLKPTFGGAATSLKHFSPLHFMSPQLLHALGLVTHPDTLAMTLRMDDGQEIERRIPADTTEAAVPGYSVDSWLNPHPQIEGSGWQSCLPEDRVSLPISALDMNVHHQFLDNILYVQVNENWNYRDRNVKKYLRAVADTMARQRPLLTILDLRFNVGGDYHLVRPFMHAVRQSLPDDQQFYVITGHGTFSAGLITAAYAQADFGDRVTFVGDAPGDYLQFWADGGAPMTLPNSRISVRMWRAFHDWENGCKDLRKCFWFTVFDGVAAGPFELDEPVPTRFADYRAGKDTALEHILGKITADANQN